MEHADHGDPEAQYLLGKLYLDGVDIPKNTEIAIKLFTRSDSQDYAKSSFMLSYIYGSGNGVPLSKITSLNYLKRASYLDLSEANMQLAMYYINNPKQDINNSFRAGELLALEKKKGNKEAEFILNRNESDCLKSDEMKSWHVFSCALAAGNGNPKVDRIIAFFYWNGLVLPKRTMVGTSWLRYAALKGDIESQILLMSCYHRGYGIEKDTVEELAWLFVIQSMRNYKDVFPDGYPPDALELGLNDLKEASPAEIKSAQKLSHSYTEQINAYLNATHLAPTRTAARR